MKSHGGFTLIEILVVVAIVASLAALAIPSQLRARMVANESTAIGNLGALMGALDMYRSVIQVYPATGAWQASMFDDADPDFASVKFAGTMTAQAIQGYLYTYTRMAGTDGGGYELSLLPATVSRTGDRAFYANHTGTMRHCTCGGDPSCTGATAADNPIQQAPTSC